MLDCVAPLAKTVEGTSAVRRCHGEARCNNGIRDREVGEASRTSLRCLRATRGSTQTSRISVRYARWTMGR